MKTVQLLNVIPQDLNVLEEFLKLFKK